MIDYNNLPPNYKMPRTLILSVAISFLGGIVGVGGYTVMGRWALIPTFISVVIGTILLRSRWSCLVVPSAVAGGVALGALLMLPIPGMFSTLTGILGFILYDSLVTLGGIFLTRKFLSRRATSSTALKDTRSPDNK